LNIGDAVAVVIGIRIEREIAALKRRARIDARAGIHIIVAIPVIFRIPVAVIVAR
jgi:hypothetical protein